MLNLNTHVVRRLVLAICVAITSSLMAGIQVQSQSSKKTPQKVDTKKNDDPPKTASQPKDSPRNVATKQDVAKQASILKKSDIAKLIGELNSPDFSIRHRATRELWHGGVEAEPQLLEAAKTSNLETRSRINAILERFRYGIFPGTPAEIVDLIHQFRNGDRTAKYKALAAMSTKKAYASVARLIRKESDEKIRAELAKKFTGETESAVAGQIAAAEYTDAERLLQLLTTFDTDGTQLRSYAAFLFLRGELSARLEQMAALAPGKLQLPQRRLRAHLLKCRGDFDGAFEIAKEINDTHLQADIHFRRFEWDRLAANALIPGDDGVEKLGFALAFHQLAGHGDAVQNSVTALKQFADDTPAQAYHCGEALMISGHWNEAREILAKADLTQRQSFELLAYQQHYAAAFKQFGIDAPRTGSVDWYKQKLAPAPGEADTSKLQLNRIRKGFHDGVLVARTLQQLGEHEEAGRMFDELATAADRAGSSYARALFDTIYELGLEERTLQRAVTALKSSTNESSVFYTLFRTKSTTARSIWNHLSYGKKDAPDRAERFLELLRLLKHPLAKDKPPTRNVAETIDAYAESLAKAPRSTASNGYRAAIDVCELHGLESKARDLCKAWAGISPTAEPRLRLGQSYAKSETWDKASEVYREAWQIAPSTPLALYLTGHALTHLDGKAEEGRDLIQRARLMPLGNSATRRTFAEGLAEHGLEDEATEEWRLILRFGAFDEWDGAQAWAVSRANRNVANAIRETHEIDAADQWRHWMMFLLKTNMGFTAIRYYPAISAQIHRTRAKGLLKTAKTDLAVDEIRRAQQAAPGDIRLVLELWDALQKAGRQEFADELFKGVEQANRHVIETFPNSPLQFNNLAWMMARTDHNVAAALPLAQRAVELRPKSGAYLDTLAEVHFRLGNRDEAIRFCKRAIEVEPESEHHREQLKRFSGSE
ncbi:MAG: hypothetical protein O3A00_04630 [Planctomycetota bacterium]|nr:hypothetical protein [Planctomycetota bacterium]